jgi:hypothetical protein
MPVVSPTLTICVTSTGNTRVSPNGAATDSPRSIAARVAITASSNTAFPAVPAVISRLSRIGTPTPSNADSVRQNRAAAFRRTMSPIAGSRSTTPSTANRPRPVE